MDSDCPCNCHTRPGSKYGCTFCAEHHAQPAETMEQIAHNAVREAKQKLGPGGVVIVMLGDFMANNYGVWFSGPPLIVRGLKDAGNGLLDEQLNKKT
ncbi:MAG TPA: hypothetical protein VKO45_09080 [Methanomicrobiales archaeon]|nr:hypothetical protein [Methanomicrobiales archaeon]